MSDVPRIRIADIHKSFGPLEVLRGVSFDVHRGSVVSVIGASGSGKSTLLRCVNHLEPPNSGEIYIEGEPLGSRIDARGQRKPRSLAEINAMRRELGVVFQQFNLWPHMTVLGNVIEAPIRVRKVPRKEAIAYGEECLRRVQLIDKARRIPGAALRRAAAARRDRARAGDAAEGDAVRRGDLLARPRADRRSAQRDARTRGGRHDHDRGDARDGLRARGVRPRHLPASGRDRGGRAARATSSTRRSPNGCASSSPSTGNRRALSDALKQSLDLSMFWEYRAILLQGLIFNALVFLCCRERRAVGRARRGAVAHQPLLADALDRHAARRGVPQCARLHHAGVGAFRAAAADRSW